MGPTGHRLRREGDLWVLAGNSVSVRGDRTETTAIRDPDHLREVLETWFSLEFPAGTRFSRPEL